MRPLNDAELLGELESRVVENLDRHLAVAQEWFPHEWVPWSRGRDFTGEEGLPWTAGQSRLPEAIQAAFEVNLLTEDNLPFYHHELATRFGRSGAWGTWINRWTAEEARHAMSIRDYLILSRAVDPVALERDRMASMQAGWTAERRGLETGSLPEDRRTGDMPAARRKDALHSLVYVTLQELATRISHRNTGKLLDDPAGYEIMKRVAVDENHHFLFYRDVASAALELWPSEMMMAIDVEVRGFEMPGTGIENFSEHARAIARAGIYDYGIHHDQILEPVVMRHWKIDALEGLTPEAEQARERVVAFIDRVGRVGERQRERAATPA